MPRRDRRDKRRRAEPPDPFIENELGKVWPPVHFVRSPPGGLKIGRECDDAGRLVERIYHDDLYDAFSGDDVGIQWALVETSEERRQFNLREIAEHARKFGKMRDYGHGA